jgi:hypothetical protein
MGQEAMGQQAIGQQAIGQVAAHFQPVAFGGLPAAPNDPAFVPRLKISPAVVIGRARLPDIPKNNDRIRAGEIAARRLRAPSTTIYRKLSLAALTSSSH